MIKIRILCVDDDATALEQNVRMCRSLPARPDAQGMQSGREALLWLERNQADIVILDVNMPGMDGITLAGRVKELRPEVSVIFLTNHPEYAVEAFGLHACGYLIKPVDKERLAAEVAYAVKIRGLFKESPAVKVRTFGEFDVFVNGAPVVFKRSRAKELLAYLVDRQGGFVTRASVFAVLWEDGLYDRSMQKQLDVVIRSLRATLSEYGISDIIEMRKGALRVVPEKFDCDLYRFFKGESKSAALYRGEYMNAYSWANLTESYILKSFDLTQERRQNP